MKSMLHQFWVLPKETTPARVSVTQEVNVHLVTGNLSIVTQEVDVDLQTGNESTVTQVVNAHLQTGSQISIVFLSLPSESLTLTIFMGAPGPSQLGAARSGVAICPSKAFKMLSASVYLLMNTLTLIINMNQRKCSLALPLNRLQKHSTLRCFIQQVIIHNIYQIKCHLGRPCPGNRGCGFTSCLQFWRNRSTSYRGQKDNLFSIYTKQYQVVPSNMNFIFLLLNCLLGCPVRESGPGNESFRTSIVEHCHDVMRAVLVLVSKRFVPSVSSKLTCSWGWRILVSLLAITHHCLLMFFN